MANLGIDGLSSGLDTTSIINQLMQLERQPAVRLENTISSNTKAITALKGLSTKLTSVLDAAKALTDATTSFLPRKATATDASVTATATAGADLGSTSFAVTSLATTHRVVTASTVADADTVVSAGGTSITLSADGTDTPVVIEAGATLRDVATAINSADAGVTAQVVNTGNGLKLQLTSTTGGAAGTFTADLSGLDAAAFAGNDTSTAVLSQGTDAALQVGTGPGAYTVTSSTNTFTGLLPGLSFTVTQADPAKQITVSVDGDPDQLADRVKAFVDAVNGALSEIDRQLDSGINSGAKGALSGDATVRSLRDQLLTAVTYAVAGTELQSGGLVGLQSTREGTLQFDRDTFLRALEENPAAVEALFRSGDPDAPGIADRVREVARTATAFGTGTIPTAITSRENRNRSLQDSIDAIDRRLELRRQTMVRQWAALEVAMGNMQAQQSWLSSQIGAINATNAASK